MTTIASGLTWKATEPGIPPPWGLGLFPTLGLPNEQRGEVSLWAGDPADKKGGVSAQIVWSRKNGLFTVTLYTGLNAAAWRWGTAHDLFSAYMICVDHFNKHPLYPRR